eukprot:4323029-Pyramimonas_sp.AAC.1
MSPHCSACESKGGPFGHMWCDCPAPMQPDESEFLSGAEVLPERHTSYQDAPRAIGRRPRYILTMIS